jgi:hypothetical protein
MSIYFTVYVRIFVNLNDSYSCCNTSASFILNTLTERRNITEKITIVMSRTGTRKCHTFKLMW